MSESDASTPGRGATPAGPPRPGRRQFLMAMAGGGAALAGAGLLGWFHWGASRGLRRVVRSGYAIGTKVSMAALHPREAVAEKALIAAFAELEEIEEVMSLYRPESQVSRLNREGVLDDPHPHLVRILEVARRASERSDGAFDVTVQPLWDLFANAEGIPGAEEIRAARRKVDWRRVEVAPGRIRLRGEGTAITLNGIAQGFATDRALAVLRARGIEHALVNAGEIGAAGRKEGDKPWTVGVQHPRRADAYIELARLDGRCMATSGDYASTFTPDRSYNHIFDPATGRSPGTFSSVTVAAPDAVQADALSTAIFVTGIGKGLELLAETPGADALFVLKDGSTRATKGFPRVS